MRVEYRESFSSAWTLSPFRVVVQFIDTFEVTLVTASAQAPITGYLYQFQYALYRLLLGTASTHIGIETDDDVVAVSRSSDGDAHIDFVQSKVSLQEGAQPLGDRSRNLWHTLHIWLTLDERYSGDQLAFYFLTNKEVPTIALVSQLAAAETADELAECILHLNNIGPSLKGKALEAATAVLTYGDEKLTNLVRRISFGLCRFQWKWTASAIDGRSQGHSGLHGIAQQVF